MDQEHIDRDLEQSERESIAAAIWTQTDLTMVEVGEIVDRSQAWVARAVNQTARGES